MSTVDLTYKKKTKYAKYKQDYDYLNTVEHANYMRDYLKAYREEHAFTVECECGSVYKSVSRYAHKKSKKHQEYSSK